ncbi:putative predicted protein [Rhizobium favelukesii]|uniref:Uncharacterized protein n=1 Tax=Rhizobium favelukesii TaxID=348824 RepID=W6RA23_9HYPH|nr:putative predicted protein [Rhizobium favelukesii]
MPETATKTTFSTKFIVFYQWLTSQIIVAGAGLLPQLHRKRVAPLICPSLSALDRAYTCLVFLSCS